MHAWNPLRQLRVPGQPDSLFLKRRCFSPLLEVYEGWARTGDRGLLDRNHTTGQKFRARVRLWSSRPLPCGVGAGRARAQETTPATCQELSQVSAQVILLQKSQA